MAPPRKRRPGYDRKAQYRQFAGAVIAIAGAVVSLLIVIVSAADPAGFAVARGGIAEVTRPISSGLRAALLTVGNLDEIVSAYLNAGSQNISLRRDAAATRTKLIEAQAIRQENARLRALLKMSESDQGIVAVGRLISSSSSNSRRLALLNIGSGKGVQAGMPVRAPEGLVGRVMWTSPNTAQIVLLTDGDNIVPVRRLRDNIPGISRGRDDGTLEVRALNADRNPFRPGDIFVTSGIGGIYPPNIPVAIVARLANDHAIAIPLANPGWTDLVAVQRSFQGVVASREAAENSSGAASNAAAAQ